MLDLFFENEYTPWVWQDIFPEPILPPLVPIITSPDSLDSQNPRPPMSQSNNGSHNNHAVKSWKAGEDERKRRRKASNRESAKRSRMRKKQYTENLMNEATRLGVVNRELLNYLKVISHRTQLLRVENDQLHAESTLLQRDLIKMKHHVVMGMLLPSSSTCCMLSPIDPEQVIAFT
ncbi:hypothetical protein SAY87_005822 [Trapa incisa]|uniref:BZIP domain-containing protein n=1 Tax=Trapa incisa TaxID=236973 RepID=A0AAN7K6R6_9MYRT|nr:hypothetical protein SAY87_005822 [Trapa incisa]